MQTILQTRAVVRADHQIELLLPELAEGVTVEVTVQKVDGVE